MDFTKNILEGWGFGSVVEVFLDNNIDEDIFHTLTENDIKELIPALGTRKKFIIKYSEYLLQHAIEKPVVTVENAPDETISLPSTSSNISSVIDLDELRPNLPYSLKATLGQPYVITPYSTDLGETVRPLLDNSEEGLIIKKSYGPDKKFLRNNLCSLIIKNELKNSTDKRISTQRFQKLAQEINDIFIHEDASIYYLPYTKGNDGKVVAARGKLWSTYVHQRQLYKRAGLLKKVMNETPSSYHENVEDNEEILDLLLWLKNNSEPFNEVLNNWQKTARIRLNFNAETESIDEYFKKYPALGKQTGHILLNSDFNYIHENRENSLFHNWPIISKIVYDALKKKKDSYLKELMATEEDEEVTDDSIQIIAFKYLPLLLQAPLIKTKVNKHWKPSKQELIDGFILFINDIVDLDSTLEKRLNKCNTYKLTAQPVPIIVGSSWHNIQCFVSVNKVLYKVESVVKAVDLCFKIFHALNANYPPEAEPAWMFVQQGIFKINTKLDKTYSSVQSLIADINMSLNKK